MRRLFCIAAALGLVMCAPGGAWADNQETAQQIASNLRTSGKMKGYSVGVKVEDGTAWLNGTVANQEQMVTALSIAQQTDGIDRVVNNLTIATAKAGGKSSSGLHQPENVSRHGDAAVKTPVNALTSRRNPIMQTGMMDIPDQAKSDLMVAGPPAAIGRGQHDRDGSIRSADAAADGRKQPCAVPVGSNATQRSACPHGCDGSRWSWWSR